MLPVMFKARRSRFLPVAAALTVGAVFAGLPAEGVAGDRAAFRKSYETGKNYYGFCMFCHAKDGKGTPLGDGRTMAPPLAGSKRVVGNKEIVTRIVLHGLTGKVDEVVYERNGVAMQPPPDLMAKDDEIMAGLLTYIRNSWGNEAGEITAAEVKAIRKKEAGRDKPWTLEELAKAFPEEVKKPE
mgnify:FL=1